jgi:hypothetical protein
MKTPSRQSDRTGEQQWSTLTKSRTRGLFDYRPIRRLVIFRQIPNHRIVRGVLQNCDRRLHEQLTRTRRAQHNFLRHDYAGEYVIDPGSR